jgi:hypothetical protein
MTKSRSERDIQDGGGAAVAHDLARASNGGKRDRFGMVLRNWWTEHQSERRQWTPFVGLRSEQMLLQ